MMQHASVRSTEQNTSIFHDEIHGGETPLSMHERTVETQLCTKDADIKPITLTRVSGQETLRRQRPPQQA